MQDNTRPQYAPAASRTWAARTVYRECGVTVEIVEQTVTLTRTAQGLQAEVNGQPAELGRAIRILQGADRVTVTAETLLTPEPSPAPTIGKARARRLHRILGRLGLSNAQHYRFASVALGQPVESLAALTEGQARRVWADVLALFPEAAGAAA